MNPTITAFAQSPDRGRGLARDMAVRWAFEEVGQPYDVRPLTFAELKQPVHRLLQPFGQIPTYQDEGLALFGSAAIVLHITELHGALLPDSAEGRARAIAWMFAAKGTVEPPIVEPSMAVLFEADRTWHEERLTMLDERVRVRLADLAPWLSDCDWLEESFTAADVVMVTVLRRLAGSGLLDEQPRVAAYVARGKRGRHSSEPSPPSAQRSRPQRQRVGRVLLRRYSAGGVSAFSQAEAPSVGSGPATTLGETGMCVGRGRGGCPHRA